MVIQKLSIVKKKSQIKFKLNITGVIFQPGRKIVICVNCEATFQLNVGKEMKKGNIRKNVNTRKR